MSKGRGNRGTVIRYFWLDRRHYSNFAKATYAVIAKTYAYLTPDLWKEMPLGSTPYQAYSDFLSKPTACLHADA
ncbi:40S ribosomal protein S2-like [Drosophila pseudoobscura]|uniref:40S ribosomal protein S2-like n=1 Tax=Drosophila pseudoobscura pseudoobscura TaxID=46245 RepID=A0A6I8WBE2_DROPS|nr:40S ribosomal protein S2-like [Drosophila pseudoobscura]